MARLPVVGSDANAWGDVLNQFEQVSHNADGTLIGLEGITTVTYSASMTIDPSVTRSYLIVPTNSTAFTINISVLSMAGTLKTGQDIRIMIKNTTGGALGAITNGTLIKATSWTAPATGFSRTKILMYDGTNFIQIAETTADIPN